jgi:hypothetical protein
MGCVGFRIFVGFVGVIERMDWERFGKRRDEEMNFSEERGIKREDETKVVRGKVDLLWNVYSSQFLCLSHSSPSYILPRSMP